MIESIPKSQFAPKSPKGDFLKLLIYSLPSLGAGIKKLKISSFLTFRSGLMIQKLITFITLLSILGLFSCTTKSTEKGNDSSLFSKWKLISEQSEVELLIRNDSTFHVDVLTQIGIEVEGKLNISSSELTFINTHGTDSISSDPSPGKYSFVIKSDTIYFQEINDPLSRRKGFLLRPWLKQ